MISFEEVTIWNKQSNEKTNRKDVQTLQEKERKLIDFSNWLDKSKNRPSSFYELIHNFKLNF